MTDTTPSLLITTDDTLTEADTEQLRADVQIDARQSLLGESGRPRPLPLSLIDLAAALEQLLNSRIFCTACAYAAHKAGGLHGAVQLNLANVIADGNGLCFAHVAFADTAAVEVKTAGGIVIPSGAHA